MPLLRCRLSSPEHDELAATPPPKESTGKETENKDSSSQMRNNNEEGSKTWNFKITQIGDREHGKEQWQQEQHDSGSSSEVKASQSLFLSLWHV